MDNILNYMNHKITKLIMVSFGLGLGVLVGIQVSNLKHLYYS